MTVPDWKDYLSQLGPRTVLLSPIREIALRGSIDMQRARDLKNLAGALADLGLIDADSGAGPLILRAPVSDNVKASDLPTDTIRQQPKDCAGKTYLIIPDAHFHQGDKHLYRAGIIGMVARDHAVDAVICMGDWFDCGSLSRHNKARQREGNRLELDTIASYDALRLLHAPLIEHNVQCAETHPEAMLAPELYYIEGNHEAWMERYLDDHPELEGLIGLDQLGFEDRGWKVFRHPHEVLELDGVLYTHFWQNPISGRSIGGVNPGRNLLIKLHRSVVQAHTHTFSHHTEPTAKPGQKIHGLVAGCWFWHHARYAGQSNAAWWRGLTLMTMTGPGDFQIQQLRAEALRHDYERAARAQEERVLHGNQPF